MAEILYDVRRNQQLSIPIRVQQFYPEIYFPNKLVDFNKNWKTRIEEKLTPPLPVKPKEPIKLESPKFEIALLLSPILFFGIFIYAVTKKESNVFIVAIIWSTIYIFSYLYSLISYPKKVTQYNKEFADYIQSNHDYEKKLNERDKEIQNLQKNLENITWRYQKRLEFTRIMMKPARKAEINYKNPIMGKSELFFKNHLIEVFGDSIKTDKVIEIFTYGNYDGYNYSFDDSFYNSKADNAYVPDFIFEHPISGLCINIEIDEPFSNRKPIHFLGNQHDGKRNEYFNNHNWIVIRFSEFQIMSSPFSCCKEIASIICDLIGDNSYLMKLNNHERIFRHKKWNSSEAGNFGTLSLKNLYFNSNRKINYTKEFSISGTYNRGNKIYKIISSGEIIEVSKSSLNEVVTDKGKFIQQITSDYRNILGIQWQNSKAKYIVENCDEVGMLWTDIYSRDYIYFQRQNS